MDYKILDLYERFGFDLVPIASNQKIPIEKEWCTKVHKNKEEWTSWLLNGLNLGVKCGKCSNITIIDIDTKEIPIEISKLIQNVHTLIQKTPNGWHLFFEYTQDLPKTRIDELKIDIQNDGGQCVVFPSIVDGQTRTMIIEDIIAPMPEELKKFLLSKITYIPKKTISETIANSINDSNLHLDIIDEGNRNTFLMHLGGILRKELNTSQVEYTLGVVNRHFCNPPLKLKELNNVINSLDKYIIHNEKDLALKILQYLKVVEEASAKDIKDNFGEKTAEGKQRIDRAIKFLENEGYLFKKRKEYHLIKRAEWKTSLLDEGKEINFKMPYFHDYAIFRDGDMVVIGGMTGSGKTHIGMSIVKQLVEQGIQPHYISLESGARYVNVALKLGLKEGDFKHCVHFSPEDVELEKNAVTIVDWLLPNDYATTDKLYKYFAEQLVKQGGILIVFAQLMKNGNFFAQNMIEMFPSAVVKFLYEDEEGINSFFQFTKIRESRINKKNNKILTYYDWNTKELKVRT